MTKRLSLMICLSLISTYSVAHSGHVFTPAIEACEHAQLSQQCNFISGGNKRYKGTCQRLNEVKMCVRNQPIEQLDDTHDEKETSYQFKVINNNKWQPSPW